MKQLDTLIQQLHERIKIIQEKTVLPDSLEDKQAYYTFFRRGQLSAYETTIKLINKTFDTSYEQPK